MANDFLPGSDQVLPEMPGDSGLMATPEEQKEGQFLKADAEGAPTETLFSQESPPGTYKPMPWEDKPEHLGEQPEFMPGPHEWEVTEEQTVSGQLEKNLSRDNPLYQQISDRVTQNYAARGLKNSAMAASAAEMAVINTAFQVSAADAATFARSAEFNATTKNHFSAAEQAFIHNALLSDQNFSQARVLQQEQIAGQLAAIGAQASSQKALQESAQEHDLKRMEVAHAINLETIGAQHSMNLDTMSFQSELGMNEAAFANQLEIQKMDRGLLHELTRMDVQFGQAQQLNYQQTVAGMLNGSYQAMANVLATAKPKNQQNAITQLQKIMQGNMDMLGTFFGAPGGPMTQGGGGEIPPAQDYTSWGDNRRGARDTTTGGGRGAYGP